MARLGHVDVTHVSIISRVLFRVTQYKVPVPPYAIEYAIKYIDALLQTLPHTAITAVEEPTEKDPIKMIQWVITVAATLSSASALTESTYFALLLMQCKTFVLPGMEEGFLSP